MRVTPGITFVGGEFEVEALAKPGAIDGRGLEETKGSAGKTLLPARECMGVFERQPDTQATVQALMMQRILIGIALRGMILPDAAKNVQNGRLALSIGNNCRGE